MSISAHIGSTNSSGRNATGWDGEQRRAEGRDAEDHVGRGNRAAAKGSLRSKGMAGKKEKAPACPVDSALLGMGIAG
jgi:hypothetical protein